MYKYSSFEEYIQMNYLDDIKGALEEYIKENDMVVFSKNGKKEHHYDDYTINSITVYGIRYTKNKRDNVEFDVHFMTNYQVLDSVFDPKSKFPPVIENEEHFIYGMTGSFKEGFKGKKDNDIQKIEKEERISSTLVPIISNEEMDDYATKFLKEFCPEALETPMCLNVEQMLADKGIKVYYAPLEDNAFGKTYFAKDKARVYTKKGDSIFTFFNNETEEIEIEPGTILIDFDKKYELPIGAYRNTIIHEAVHWFYHSNYFELRQLLNNELTYVACFKGRGEYENEDIAWMEYQARSIAPRVLMPKETATMKWKEIVDNYEENDGDIYQTIDVLEKAFKEFAKFFGVSEKSARIRLKELGFKQVEGIRNYVDGKIIKSFVYKEDALGKNQTFIISENELRNLLKTNIFLQEALLQEKVFYINNMIVVNSPDFVDCEKYELTEYARNHIDECCFIFDIERFAITATGEKSPNYLLSTFTSRREAKSIMMDHASIVLKSTDDSYCHYLRHKKELPETFGETLEYHYKKAKAKSKSGIHSYEDLAYECNISDRTLRKYKDGEVMPKRTEVLKIALALKLSTPYIMDMLSKADCQLSFNNAENNILLTTLIAYPRVGLEMTYRILEEDHMGHILELSEDWLIDHGLKY